MNVSVRPRKFWTTSRLAFSVITFALVAGLWSSSCTGPTPVTNNGVSKTNSGQPPGKNPNSAQPVMAPLPATVMNRELTALDGTKFKLSDYPGKIVVVNLWATWCGPCRSEIPDLVKLSEEFKLKGVEVIGLTSEDPEADGEKVQDFVREFKITYKIGWGDQDFALALMQGQIKNSIPQSFVISRDGRVLKRFVGYNPTETPFKIRRALEDAINENQG